MKSTMPGQIGCHRRAKTEADCDGSLRRELRPELVEDLESIGQHRLCARPASAGRITAVMETSHMHCGELSVQAERHALEIPDVPAEAEQEHVVVALLAGRREYYTGKLGRVCGGDAQRFAELGSSVSVNEAR